MRVANFFDRSAAAMAQVLSGADPEGLRARLSTLAVILAFDRAAAESTEGSVALELTTDLLARLYPGLRPMPLDDAPSTVALAERLRKAARAIHPQIELRVQPAKACLCLVAGETDPRLDVPTLFMGSYGWTAIRGNAGPIGSSSSGNPFGAAAAACMAAAGAFRMIFADSLTGAPPAGIAVLDVLNQESRASPAEAALAPGIDLDGIHLVGLGAIGRSAAWTLARVPGLQGRLVGIDPEKIERTNLQRYVGSTQADRDKARPKTRSAAKMFEGTSVGFEGRDVTWGRYLHLNPGLRPELVAVALDTAADRIALQASLPAIVLNAWTQPGDLGVSRHGFLSGPCLACLYLPDGEVPSLSDRIADVLKLPEPKIRKMLHSGAKADHAFLELVSLSTGVEAAALRPFENTSLFEFYAKGVCGTAFFERATRGERGATAVPMAFQSALAGVLLAAEIVAEQAQIRRVAMLPVTSIDLMREMGAFLKKPAAKHSSGRCLCQDPVFRAAYRDKHAALACAQPV